MKVRFFYIIIFVVSAIILISTNLPNLAYSQVVSKKPNESSFSFQQRQELEEIIRNFLQTNPRIILKSIDNMREQHENEAKKRSLKNLAIHKKLIFNDPTSPTAGNPKGDITIVEFFDYSCGYCKRAFQSLKRLISEDKNIRLIFKELPILSPRSELAARAALAAWRQDRTKYIDIHNEFMNLKGRFSEKRILRIAENIGLDLIQLKKDMISVALDKTILENRRLAEKLNIKGTPAFIIGKNIIPGAIELEALKKIISNVRKIQLMD